MKKLESLLTDFRRGWSLEQEFFTSQEVYLSDIQHIKLGMENMLQKLL